jgi:serine/threonine protein kinase
MQSTACLQVNALLTETTFCYTAHCQQKSSLQFLLLTVSYNTIPIPVILCSQMMETAHNIIKGDVHFPKELSPGAVDFISSCLNPNPAKQMTLIKMLNNPWVKMIEVTRPCDVL